MKRKKRYPGYFISFEKTVEGVGGSTQSKKLVDALNAQGIPAIWTREPGGTPVGEMIREILLSPKKLELARPAELFLYVADRAQHYRQVIKPALQKGTVVVSDRFVDSTMIYQGVGRGWNRALLQQLHQAATGGLLPNLTFVLDGPSQRAQPNDDRWEQLPKDFHDKLAEAALELGRSGGRYVLIDTRMQPKETSEARFERVAREIQGVTLTRLAAKGRAPYGTQNTGD